MHSDTPSAGSGANSKSFRSGVKLITKKNVSAQSYFAMYKWSKNKIIIYDIIGPVLFCVLPRLLKMQKHVLSVVFLLLLIL